jgi:hypothetical protein
MANGLENHRSSTELRGPKKMTALKVPCFGGRAMAPRAPSVEMWGIEPQS